ncbi:3-methyl-2-oxobutanoate hydroxymethyltransferase [Hyphobacterium sp.]|uniref:3-methyl-2-oxobutanoate hydroxymethyltransferase n=1 Tax=Hyphobacterium sp. TaxID=2004662 RepID=UPI003BAD47FB
MSAQSQKNRLTVPQVRARKGGEPLVCLTAYDAAMARLLDAHCDILLVGDSLGMVVHGMDSTIGVTLDMMVLHGQAVMRAAKQALVVIDLPFGTYEKSPEQAFQSASWVLSATGAQAVKIESGVYAAETIRFLTDRGIPVMGHVGLRPQASLSEGGFKAKGRDDAERQRVLDEAKAADEAGAFAIVIEGVEEGLAREITQAVSAPAIGIGASAACDGQILVTQDMLGLFDWAPKFVRRYGQMSAMIEDAVGRYAEDVKSRAFPGANETYSFKQKNG